MNENKKIFIIIILIFFIIMLCINKKGNNPIVETQENSQSLINEMSAETDIKNSINECNNIYKKYGSKNFEVYFSIDFINENLEYGNVKLENYAEQKDFSWIEIYNQNSEKIEKFPNIEYERNENLIEPNKSYLISYESSENSYKYYYLIKIDKRGSANLTMVCYTLGEYEELEDRLVEI